MRISAITFFFCFLFSGLFSQSKQETEVYLIGFRINQLTKTDPNHYRATIDHGLDVGIQLNMRASVYGKLQTTGPLHNHELGSAVWIEVSPHRAIAEITALENETVLAGDLLYSNITLPKLQRSAYFFLITEDILLTNDEGAPYYNAADLLVNDGYKLRTEKFLAMQAEIRAAGEKLKQAGEKRKVEAGPNIDQNLAEVMINADTLDVWLYVYHLHQMNVETRGQTIRLTEGFMHYALEGDAISPALLKSTFLSAKTEAINDRFKEYHRKINRDLLESWTKEAQAMMNRGEYSQSEALFTITVDLALRVGNLYDAGVYWIGKAELYDAQELYEKSLEAYTASIKPFIDANSDRTQLALGFAYHNIGLTQYRLQAYEKSAEAYSKAIDIRAKLAKDNPTEVNHLNNLYTTSNGMASVAMALKEYQSALELYQACLIVAQKAGNKTDEGSTLWNIGFVYVEKLNTPAEGIPYYEKAFPIYLTLSDTSGAVSLKRNTAIAYTALKNIAKAKMMVEEGVSVAKSWGNRKTLTYILEYQGLFGFENSDWPFSIIGYAEAEKIYEEMKDVPNLVTVKKKLAKSLREAKRNDEAIVKFQERIQLIEENDHATKADAEWDLAYTYGVKKKRKDEIMHYRQAEKYYLLLKDSANLSTILNNIGYTYRDSRDSVNSYREHWRAIALDKKRSDPAALANSYEHLGNSYKEFKNFTFAGKYFKKAQKIYEATGDFLKTGNMVDKQADCFVERKLFTQAIATFKEASLYYRKAKNKKEEADAIWDYAYYMGQELKMRDPAIVQYKIAYDLYMEIPDSVNASTMLSNIGQTYWGKVDYENAIKWHQAAIILAKKCRNQQQVAQSWSKLATLYKESNNPISASMALNNAAEALLTVNDSTLLASTYLDLSVSYSSSKQYVKAIDYCDRSMLINRARKDTANLAMGLYQLAAVYHNQMAFKNAEKYYLETMSLRKKIKAQEGVVYCLAGLGNLETSITNNYKKAEQYFLEGERIAREIKSEYILAYIYGQMKWMYRSQGKGAMAISCVEKSLELYRKNKYWKEYASTLSSMAYDASNVSGDQPRGLKLLDQAQAVADTIKDISLQADIFGQRGSVLLQMGEFQQAIGYANKSMDLYKQIDNEWGVAGVFLDNGLILKQLSDYEEAIRFQQKSDSLYHKIGAEYARLAPLANIGENYAAQGDYLKAIEFYHKSLAILTKANDMNENLAIIQGLMGEANFYLNNYAEADKWLKQSLVTCDKAGALRPKTDNLATIGRLKIEEKKFEEARTYLKEGLKIAKEKSMKLAYLNNLVVLGRLEVEQKNDVVAKQLLEECIKTSREISKYNTLWESLYWMGVSYANAKQLPQSRDALKEAVSIIEKIRNKVSGGEEARKLFSSDKNIQRVYEHLVDVLLQLGETDLAMSYLQKNNDDNLKAKFKSMDIKFQDNTKNEVIVKERDMKAKLDGIEQQISNEKALPTDKQNLVKLKNLEGIQSIAEGDYLIFVNKQVNVQPELSKFFNNSVQPSEFRKRKKDIPPDMALLSYLPGEKQLYIFMVTSDTVIAKVVNITGAQLSRDVNAVLNIVRTNQGSFGKLDVSNESAERRELVSEMKQSDKMMRPFEELYHYLIAPVSAEIAGKKKLCIIPNGPLSYIPFQLLGKTLQNGKFSLMANQFSIFYANSTDMLLRTLEAEAKTYNILAFGNPDKTLPSAEREVSDIKKLFPNAAVYTGAEATEDKVKFAGEKFNVMHFATHGNLDYEDFSQSYLTMAGNPSKNEDGKLTLEELWGMEVMNHLSIVVLSACQTAVTKGSNETSPVSPASGFLQNGVKSVVATLWKVDDEATAILINDFYKNIKTMDAIDALRSAQVSLSSNPKFSYPYYWAGAILLGDWR